MRITAREIAEARHVLLRDLDMARTMHVHPDMRTAEIGAYMTAINGVHLNAADLFAVAPDACALADVAAADLPHTYRPPHEDIPTPTGLMVWEDTRLQVPDTNADGQGTPGEPLPVVAASWHVGPGSTGVVGVLFTLYTHRDAARAWPTWQSALAPVRMGSFLIGDGHPADPWTSGDPDTDRTVRVMLATWLLIHQGATTADEATAAPTRSRLARTLAKRGRPLADVRVVDLHRPTTSGADASSGRTVTVRYAVRGHWRNQPYGPARALRRPVWVAPHVRGPDDAPWSGGTTVARLRAPSSETPGDPT